MDLAKIIDHTLLKTDATSTDIARICAEARECGFASVCVSPIWVKEAAKELAGSSVAVCTVIGFPQGATPTAVKAFEARQAIADGASELDMVLPVGKLKGGEAEDVRTDIAAVVAEASKGGALVKVIIECCLLTDEEKCEACRIAKEAGADFVKTSTGFSSGGATVRDVALMREAAGPAMGVKAAGGIHSRAEAEAMLAAGATRIGASQGRAIIEK